MNRHFSDIEVQSFSYIKHIKYMQMKSLFGYNLFQFNEILTM